MAKTIRLEPLHEDQRRVYRGLGRRSVLRCGRRWGKSALLEIASANWALRYGWKVGVFAPDFKKSAPSFRNLLHTLRPAIAQSSKVEKIIELKNDGLIEFLSLQDPDAGRSRKYHRVLIDEASLTKPEMQHQWEQSIAPTLLDYAGSAIVAGTPKGVNIENFFWRLCNNEGLSEHWDAFHAPTFLNPHLPASELATIESRTHPLVYRQEYLAEFVDWRGVSLLSLENLAPGGKGVPFPVGCDYVGAAFDTALKDGQEHDGSAVVYFARNSMGTPLTILDWDVFQVQANLLPERVPQILARLNELAKQCGARFGSSGIYCEDKGSGTIVIQHAESQGWPVQAIPGDMVSLGKDARAVACSGPVFRNEVRFSQLAVDKQVMFKGIMANHLIQQFCGFTLADAQAYKRADDLFDAAAYSILVTLNPSF